MARRTEDAVAYSYTEAFNHPSNPAFASSRAARRNAAFVEGPGECGGREKRFVVIFMLAFFPSRLLFVSASHPA